MIAELLRRRNLAQQQATMASGSAQQYGSMFQNPQFQQTIKGANGQPDLVQANWGDILGKGVANYMGAKERKEAITKTQEVAQINSDFMNTTLKSDPVAQKLYGAVQAGIPGADKALTDHMAPKKQSMAIIVQGLTSGMLSPDMAAEVAKSQGLDENVVRAAAEYAAKKQEAKTADKYGQQIDLANINNQAKADLQANKPTKTGYTQAELNAMPIEQRIAAVQASSGRETAESKARGKLKVQYEQELPKTDYAIKNTADIINMANKADFWPGNLGMKNPKLTTNSNNAMLMQAIDQLVLDEAGGKLGGGVSNADVIFLKNAKVSLTSGNRETAVAQLNRFLDKLQSHRDQMAKGMGEGAQAAPATNTPASRFDTTNVKERRAAQQPAPSFDDAWKEVGGE
jgi:hypothetical protein